STGRLQRFDENGKFITSWMVEGKKGFPTLDLAADRSGNVYAVRGGQILKYDSDGKLLTKFANSPNFYEEVTVMPDGSLLAFVSFPDDDLIRLNAQGREVSRIKKIVSSQTDEPESGSLELAVDGLGNLFVLSTRSSAVF